MKTNEPIGSSFEKEEEHYHERELRIQRRFKTVLIVVAIIGLSILIYLVG